MTSPVPADARKRVAIEDHRVPMRDGTVLATDVFVADDGPKPAMVMRGPYSRAMARQSSDAIGLARSGWAVVVQDVRGRFDSQGEFDPFRDDRDDGVDTIDWVAGQPWCDGRVVGHGGSYLGFTQWLAAVRRPPALRALSVMCAGADVRASMMYEGGALQLGVVAPWALGMAMTAPDPASELREQAAAQADDWAEFLRQPLAAQPLRRLFPPFDRWLDRDDDDYWAGVDVTSAVADVAVPAYQVAGWYDIFCEGALQMYSAMRAGAATEYARAGQRLVVGPWAHTSMLFPVTAHYNFGPSANGQARGIPAEMMQWLRDAVDGRPLQSGIDLYVLGSGEWRSLETWPPPASPTNLYLSATAPANSLRGGGVLSPRPQEAGSDHFRYDPSSPVPTRGGRLHGPLLPGAGPVDQRPVEERDDVLVYTSEPLPGDITVIGTITARILFATSGRSADVTVKVVDVHPDGFAFNVVDSVRRESFEPGVPRPVDVTVGSTAIRFGAGHRIRVEISSSNFPRLDRNPSTGETPVTAETLQPADQTIHHGGREPSFVTLPVVDGGSL